MLLRLHEQFLIFLHLFAALCCIILLLYLKWAVTKKQIFGINSLDKHNTGLDFALETIND